MKLNELLDVELLNQHIIDGNIILKLHPTLPLMILNYSKKCQYDNIWDDVTKNCRGLIIDTTYDNNVVGMGFQKFFNYGQSGSESVVTTGKIDVTDKADGSLIIACFYQGELVVATRGSFESTMAKDAYNIINDKYLDALKIIAGENSEFSVLFEYISPDNRIVLDYGDMHDLILLGAIPNIVLSNGRQMWKPARMFYCWPGPKVVSFEFNSFQEVLQASPRDNAEGYVIFFVETGDRLKIKQEDYVELHRLISDLTEKRIWEKLSSGEKLEEFAAKLPDEFYDYATNIATQLISNKEKLLAEITMDYKRIINSIPINFTRKEFAFAIKDHPHKAALFSCLDDNMDRVLECVWKMIQPMN